jgi:hypothetical protein
MKMAVFWVVAPRSSVAVYERFRDACCLHRQGDSHVQEVPENVSTYIVAVIFLPVFTKAG